MNSTASKNLLLTGSPGCGKTTVLQRMLELVSELRLAGFYTQEMRRGGRRVGFEAIALGGQRTVLARVDWSTKCRVGRYGVKPEALDPLLLAELDKGNNEVDAFVIDEIGKMECYSPRFVEAVQAALESSTPVVATVALNGGGFITEAKARDDVDLIEVTTGNRDDLPVQIADWVHDLKAKAHL